MDKHTVGAVLALVVCIGGCGCITARPAPAPIVETPAPEPERTCTTCKEVCVAHEGFMICESECQTGNRCPLHDEEEKDLEKALKEPFLQIPPAEPSATEPEPPGRVFEL